MKRKSPNITSKLWSCSAVLAVLILWQVLTGFGIVEGFMLPSPNAVARAFVQEFPALMGHARITLSEAFLGLALGILTGFVMAVLMDRFDRLYQAFYPLIVLTQTVPAVAIAPLLRPMGAGRSQIFFYIKLPGALGQFLSSLRISASYAVVGAVIAEWLGGFGGLGVYMTRVKKAFAFDKMFAVIILISAISLLLMWAVERLQKKCMPWENSNRD